MAKFKYSLSIGISGCKIEDEVVIEDTLFYDLTQKERDEYIEQEIKEIVFNNIDWGYIEIDENSETRKEML